MKYWKIFLSGAFMLLVITVINFIPEDASETVRHSEEKPISRNQNVIPWENSPLTISTPYFGHGADHSLLQADEILREGILKNISLLINELQGAPYDISATLRDIDCNDVIFQGIIEKGETIEDILERAGAIKTDHYIKAAAKVFSLRSFREGQPYTIIRDPDSSAIMRFEYEINDSSRLVVEGVDKPKARVESIEYTLLLEALEGVVDDNLFQAVADIGENPQLAMQIVKLFGSEINFARNVKEGDKFSVLIEKRYRKGEYQGYGRILAATFTTNKKKYEAYLFNDGKSADGYFNAKGENLHKELLQSPLAVTRLTSGFSHNRFHPILGINRAHLGVDYGAPTGAPVKSVGEGVVTSRGWAGGYGNQIIIKHSGGLESMYAHLSGFSRGLRVGQKVSQGQVIGYVGSTGLATGPHLDFRLRHNGKFINPAKAINPRGAPIAANNMKKFRRVMELEKACLEGKKLANYTVDSIVPLAVFSDEDDAPQVASARGIPKYRRSRYIVKQSVLDKLKKARWERLRKLRKKGDRYDYRFTLERP